MSGRVKLCAIAKNEGAYLAGWVFHHLHFGVDAIEIWVNGSEDASMEVGGRIAKRRPEVSVVDADDTFQQCFSEGRSFQQHAYETMVEQARRQGFTHAAFFDIDEYWTPRDFVTSLKEFLTDEPVVKVVSFPWCMDVPDVGRQAFSHPVAASVELQMDRHVKSVVRLDDSLRRIRIHTARIHDGVRLLVREEFPMVDARAQVQGSFLLEDALVERWHGLPEAFILHALNRSQLEYIANLSKGLHQTGVDLPYRTNRHGYLPSHAPVLTFEPPRTALDYYERRREAFLHELDANLFVRQSQAAVSARAEGIRMQVEADQELSALLRPALTGTYLAGGTA